MPSFKCSLLIYEPPKISYSAMFVGVMVCGKTEFYFDCLKPYINFEFIIILCPTILDKTYLSRKWIFDDKNIFIVCDMEGELNY